ncbi:MAG: hypothetical protein ACREIA_16745 [Opitutaceae bacterium]
MLVQFPEARAKALRAEARRRKMPVAAFVRESVEVHLAKAAESPEMDKWERAKRAVGFGRSGVKDLARNHDKYLNEGKRW